MNKRLVAAASLASILLTAACSNELDEKKQTQDVIAEVEENKEEPVIEEPNEVEEPEAEEEVIKTPQYQINEANWTVQPLDNAESKVVLLTIDDVPDKSALEMAKVLKELNAPAIFFVNGHFLDTPEEKAVLKEIYDLGFSIGNHTYNHPNLSSITEEKQKEEILSINDLVEEITGERPKFFRAPFGVNTEYTKTLVAEEGMLLMNWTYGYDWDANYMTKESITDIMVNSPYLTDGANLLMHDRTWTYEGLEDIVKGLRDKGYEPVDPELIEIPNSQ